METNSHSANSVLREKLIEHVFVGDLFRCQWRRGARDMEILRPEVDRAGYDIVLEANGVVRHLQLKASFRQARTAQVGIHVDLAAKPSGCVLWILFDEASLDLGPFRWFGGPPNAPLPPLGDRVGRHTKANADGHKAERPNIRIVRKGQFELLQTIEDVAGRLFGS